jgi:hypothetical protein
MNNTKKMGVIIRFICDMFAEFGILLAPDLCFNGNIVRLLDIPINPPHPRPHMHVDLAL